MRHLHYAAVGQGRPGGESLPENAMLPRPDDLALCSVPSTVYNPPVPELANIDPQSAQEAERWIMSRSFPELERKVAVQRLAARLEALPKRLVSRACIRAAATLRRERTQAVQDDALKLLACAGPNCGERASDILWRALVTVEIRE